AWEKGSPAAAAGRGRGDRIVAVNGEPVSRWQDVSFALLASPERPVRLAIERGGRTLAATVTPRRVPRYEFGDSAGIFPSVRPQVTEVIAGGPAAAAGFRSGDEIRAVDGRPIADHQDF